jgi:divalent metal cation (Fe/Co/Zn/Cd) transporter
MSQEDAPRRRHRVVVAIWLTSISVAWGTLAGGVSVTVGLLDGSLGVLGLGLNVLADVSGSAVLVWRFRAELRQTRPADKVESRAALVVAAALGTVSLVLLVSAIRALALGSHPGHSTLGTVTAALSVVVLTPLALGKLRVATELQSRALRGDGALSGIGAAVAVIALTGLWLDDAFGLWWADRVAAIIVAGIAAAEAVRAARGRSPTAEALEAVGLRE